jgi:type IV secretion system protein VirB9
VLNFDYATTGSRRIAPQTVFDNGTLTFLRFPPGMEPPAIFVVGPDGSEGLANVRVNDDHVVVDTVAGELVLRLGRERAVVTNRGWRAPEGRTERRRGFWRD